MNLHTQILKKHYKVDFRRIIRTALDEDVPRKDITTDNLINDRAISRASITAEQDGILCGIEMVRECFHFFDRGLRIKILKKDGAFLKKGQIVMTILGRTRSILTTERTALNLLQHLSGIATHTREMVKIAGRYGVRILDTRKTLPGLRLIEKYAVIIGGGWNHRLNLSDEVLIKENHITAHGGIRKAIRTMKAKYKKPFEVEVENLNELRIALEENVRFILLDNFTISQIKKAVKMNHGRARFEVSGGVTLRTLEAVCRTGIDFVSVGSITHSSPALDFSLQLH